MLDIQTMLQALLQAVMILIQQVIVPLQYGNYVGEGSQVDYFHQCLTVLLVGWVIQIIVMLLSHQISKEADSNDWPSWIKLSSKELFLSIIVFLSLINYSLVVGYSTFQISRANQSIQCLNGDNRCQDLCLQSDILENSCLGQIKKQATKHSDAQMETICRKFDNVSLKDTCWEQFSVSENIEFTDGIIKDNVCYMNSNSQFKCIGETEINNLLLTEENGLLKERKLKKLSIYENSFIAIDSENKFYQSFDVKKQKQDESRIDELISSGVTKLSISSGRFCILNSTNNLTCSGSDLNPSLLQSGSDQSCFIHPSTHNLGCWGSSSLKNSYVPEHTQLKAVSLGASHACGILLNDELKCWGADSHNQSQVPNLAHRLQSTYDGSYNSQTLSPTQVDAGGDQTCAVLEDFSMECWGSNLHGQNTPPPDLKWSRVTASGDHACGLTMTTIAGVDIEEHQVICWGRNDQGQTAAEEVNSLLKARKDHLEMVETGVDHTCGVTQLKKELVCFGSNSHGESSVDEEFRQDAKQISLGQGFTCVAFNYEKNEMRNNRMINCFGKSDKGQTEVPKEVRMDGLTVSAGRDHACSILKSGNIQCWGGDYYITDMKRRDRLMVGADQNEDQSEVQVPEKLQYPFGFGINDVSNFALGDLEVCVRDTQTKELQCQTQGQKQRINPEDTTKTDNFCLLQDKQTVCQQTRSNQIECRDITTEAIKAKSDATGGPIKSISCGKSHVCGVQIGGSAQCLMGSSMQHEGELEGDLAEDVEQVKAGRYITCVLKKDLTVRCIGRKITNQVQEQDIVA